MKITCINIVWILIFALTACEKKVAQVPAAPVVAPAMAPVDGKPKEPTAAQKEALGSFKPVPVPPAKTYKNPTF